MTLLKRLVQTKDEAGWLLVRVALGVVMLPHGAQKALGWFGGHGFNATMQTFTEKMHIPAALAFLAIAAEFAGSMGLIVGLLTRVAALGIGVVMVVAVLTVHLQNGFFMNWFGQQSGEGFEYHILAIGMALALVWAGGGKWSIDRLLTRMSTPSAPLVLDKEPRPIRQKQPIETLGQPNSKE
jgi:putative oxidoreductase